MQTSSHQTGLWITPSSTDCAFLLSTGLKRPSGGTGPVFPIRCAYSSVVNSLCFRSCPHLAQMLLLLRRAVKLTATASSAGSPCAADAATKLFTGTRFCWCRVYILVALATGRQHRRCCRRTCLQDRAPSFFMNATLFSIGVVVGRPRSALEPPLTLISIMTGPSTAAVDRYVKAALVSASDSTVSASA